jgi:hypothetical protein
MKKSNKIGKIMIISVVVGVLYVGYQSIFGVSNEYRRDPDEYKVLSARALCEIKVDSNTSPFQSRVSAIGSPLKLTLLSTNKANVNSFKSALNIIRIDNPIMWSFTKQEQKKDLLLNLRNIVLSPQDEGTEIYIVNCSSKKKIAYYGKRGNNEVVYFDWN